MKTEVQKYQQLLVRNRFLIVVGNTYYYFQDYAHAYHFYQKLEYRYAIEYL